MKDIARAWNRTKRGWRWVTLNDINEEVDALNNGERCRMAHYWVRGVDDVEERCFQVYRPTPIDKRKKSR